MSHDGVGRVDDSAALHDQREESMVLLAVGQRRAATQLQVEAGPTVECSAAQGDVAAGANAAEVGLGKPVGSGDIDDDATVLVAGEAAGGLEQALRVRL